MKFEKKSLEEISKMTAEEKETYFAAKETHDTAVRNKEIADALKVALDPIKETAAQDATDIGERFNILEAKLNTTGADGGIDIRKTIEDNIDEIKSVFKAGHGTVEIYKAPALQTTANGTLATALPTAVGTMLAPVSDVNLRDMGILPLVRNGKSSNPVYVYTEVVPKEGDFAVVAEGGVKPLIDLQWVSRSETPKKIAAVEKLTEEVITDVEGLEDVVRNFLFKKHNLKKSKLVLFGTGTGTDPKGATVYGRTFVAGAMAAKVTAPTIMDVINAAVTDIFTTHNFQDETPYMPNVAMINPIDFFINFVSAKDYQGNPLYPSASLFNKVVIGGMTIIPEESIPAGKIFVADLSKYNVLDYVGYSVRIGWENDDMRRNQFMLIAESRFFQFVKKADELAFIYDDIATIKTAITKV